MSATLPDVAVTEPALLGAPLRWVGMHDIAIPVRLGQDGSSASLAARASVQVDLPRPECKGIHMSRLYRLLDRHLEHPVSPAMVSQLLQALIDSHEDCGSRAARLTLTFEVMLRVPALLSEGLAGWRAYPVRLEAQCSAGHSRIQLQVEVLYASTCPCSAALSRQLLSEAFLQQHAGRAAVPPEAVAQWLQVHGSYATPHSQRSIAQVRVDLEASTPQLDVGALVALCERALATPVQAAVRRIDEQAFARLNGANLMYVEDAARRLRQVLVAHYTTFDVAVRHLESLHAHDAVAETGSEVEGAFTAL
ncbi:MULTISPECIES: GTP cyclohydrolase FolE2 [Xanthomonas]|uniref:GTP cyclohydrolase FolE2 n=1 Tax=Xanthomonas cucurbitae TaxID=56453 RepID=A0A2S7DKC4_9XANT|nr:GTP cyclohydrolase FolE2 [Xanthomonas cucurbitae]PPU74204.1 GTP cyclohydrolase I FolE2 [Xanthomonas cucurbitae]QHG87276.1 GTP cyclohydrolase I FolE2 [Xanthomonas cucurbitae]WDM66081.1 GTP cyclohydrolase FolE2 [Xanthomonas cucurbitae]WDM69960.1 GTP cyclohydrolase FolE2 [Xanthomonas cucurbitae]WDM73823.1 GTP cyclohydrolase FolE2 [Xanthomonas cucurbitae]